MRKFWKYRNLEMDPTLQGFFIHLGVARYWRDEKFSFRPEMHTRCSPYLSNFWLGAFIISLACQKMHRIHRIPTQRHSICEYLCGFFFRFSFFSTFLHSRYGEHAVLHCGANNLETFPIFRSQFRPGVLKTCWWRRASRAFISFHFIFCMRAFTIFSIFRRFPSTQKHNTHIGSTQIESGFIRGEQTMRGRPLRLFFPVR